MARAMESTSLLMRTEVYQLKHLILQNVAKPLLFSKYKYVRDEKQGVKKLRRKHILLIKWTRKIFTKINLYK